MIKRIYIVGPSGSGKTTLGRSLCDKLNLPHFDLDEIAYPNKISRPHPERLKEINKLASKPAWITEGIYVDFTKELFEKADLIIWLDLPYSKTFFRVIKRFLVHKIQGNETHGVKNTLKFIWNLKAYYYPKKGEEHGTEVKMTTRHKTADALKDFRKKVARVQNNQQLTKLLKELTN